MRLNLKTEAIVAVCLLVSGCVHGDRFYSSNINISFPNKTKEQLLPSILDAGFALGYKKGGRWESNGLSLYAACRQVRDNWSECRTRFMENATWVEARERTTEKTISFWFDIVDSEGSIVFEPKVRIEDVVGGSKVEFGFTRMGTQLNPQEITEFYALKHRLTERYGSMITTENEP